MIKLDILENQVKTVYLAVGSNLGNRYKNIELSKIALINNKINIIKSSSYYETYSWPNKTDPKFLNIILKAKTILEPLELLTICKKIEISLGRRKSKKNSPRECDIDIIDYNKMIKSNGVNLPHPRMHKRSFVLIPLFEIEKQWKHPKLKHHIKSLVFDLSKNDITSIKQI